MSKVTKLAQPAKLTLKKSGTIATFASLIETYQVEGHEALNAQLRNEIAAWRESEEGIQASNFNGWHSDVTMFSRPEPGFRQLSEILRQCILSYVRRYETDFDPAKRQIGMEAWVNVNGKSGMNAPHHHAFAHISGCYYISVPKATTRTSGVLQFLSPLVTFAPPGKFGLKILPSHYDIRPEEGQIVLFPSYLVHWVHPNDEDEDRISIAVNAQVRD